MIFYIFSFFWWGGDAFVVQLWGELDLLLDAKDHRKSGGNLNQKDATLNARGGHPGIPLLCPLNSAGSSSRNKTLEFIYTSLML